MNQLVDLGQNLPQKIELGNNDNAVNDLMGGFDFGGGGLNP